MATGYEQARSVVAHLAGDDVAASRVELALPPTGVCGGVAAGSECCSSPVTEGSACCGGPVEGDAACCLDDQTAKEAGLEGCGCSSGVGVADRPSFISFASL
jgi:hypothetical protein